jgi:superoxide reductase
MKRRDVFKKIGIAGIALSASGLLFPSILKSQDFPTGKLIINRQKYSFADPQNPTDFELKHTPEITFLEADNSGFTKVRIHVGLNGIVHPTEENHWIDYLKIYNNDKLVVFTEYENGPIRGYAEFFIKLTKGDKLLVEAGCNLHGIWSNSATF